jgi:hypothetical protein
VNSNIDGGLSGYMVYLADEGSLDLEPGGRTDFEKQPSSYAKDLAITWILNYLPASNVSNPTTRFRLPLQHDQLQTTTAPTATDFSQLRRLKISTDEPVSDEPIESITLSQQVDQVAVIASGGPTMAIDMPIAGADHLDDTEPLEGALSSTSAN